MTETTTKAAVRLDLNAIEARANAATSGPWEEVVDDHGRGRIDASVWSDSIGYYIAEKISSGQRHVADAEFIAHAREDVSALVSEARLLRRKLTLLVSAAEAVESEAEGENRSSRALADMRRVMNAIPADALTDVPAAELVEQEATVSS
jgi:hypothetical protein